MSNHQLLLISGSLREASFNRKLTLEAARLFGGESVVADIRFPLYDGDLEEQGGVPDEVKTMARQIEDADAVVISGPEYNQSVSGVLKNALDWISRVDGNPWQDKPVAIMSAAAGRAGGARGQYALRLALNPFQPHLITGPEVMVAKPSAEFDDSGKLQNELYTKTLRELMDKLRAAVSCSN